MSTDPINPFNLFLIGSLVIAVALCVHFVIGQRVRSLRGFIGIVLLAVTIAYLVIVYAPLPLR